MAAAVPLAARNPTTIAAAASEREESWMQPIIPFLASGCAGCTASMAVHPVEVMKTRMQVVRQEVTWLSRERGPRLSYWKMAHDLAAREGVQGLYAGLWASLMRQATYGTARMGLYTDWTNRARRARGGAQLNFAEKVILSCASGATAVGIGNPFDVALVRMQADTLRPPEQRRGYSGVFDAFRRIHAEEGSAAFFRGFSANALRGMAMNAGMMATNDEARERLGAFGWEGRKLTLAAAFLSGFCCAFLSAPFDFAKSRLMAMRVADGSAPYRGAIDVLYRTVRAEGVLAPWTGSLAYTGRCAPHAVLCLVVKDHVTEILNHSSLA
eukprot:Hpha_TRINITY_DN15451_c2_g2::TRINITY_DN15451_c2_g2_i1::g.174821::m.174821/K15104/SLC25A11, OGC; solute carrier family 25 (mitochondrial oxoglutarate transporter), member 11